MSAIVRCDACGADVPPRSAYVMEIRTFYKDNRVRYLDICQRCKTDIENLVRAKNATKAKEASE